MINKTNSTKTKVTTPTVQVTHRGYIFLKMREVIYNSHCVNTKVGHCIDGYANKGVV